MLERNISSEKISVKNNLEASLELNQIWYTIDTTWWKKWKKYVNYGNSDNVNESEFPGPIDNSALLENDRFNGNALVGFDYEIVPEVVWKMLTDRYGLVQTDTTLYKRHVIKEGAELRVELFLLKLNMFVYGEPNKSNVVIKEFSCKSKLIDVENFVQSAFHIPEGAVYQMIQEYDNGSMHVIHYASETTTLSDAGFRLDQNLFIDLRNSEGEFSFKDSRVNYNNSKGSVRGGSSSDFFVPQPCSTSSSSGPLFNIEEKGPECSYQPGVCGLANLGNTCFMNSAIQCISNVPSLTNYFLRENWSFDLNKNNPLGMGGRIATAYANLIKEMWSGTSAYAMPRDFKYEVAQFAPQFCGYSQHDSQELMMFLLDGLHEDLNRVTNKPYIEQKHSAIQPDEIVADENWQYHQKRNDSIIVDYFHGQLKSKVVCPDCNFVSVTFDPFASLSLPLRHSYFQSVIFYPLDPMSPIVNLSISAYKNSSIEMIKDIVEKQVNFNSKNELLIAQVRKFKIERFLQTNESLCEIPSEDQIVMYEVEPLQSDHYYVDVVFKEKCMSSYLALPLIVQLYKKINWHRFMAGIKQHLPRFLTQSILDTDVDLFYANGGDKIDFIDTQSMTEDNTDNSDCDRSESVSNSSLELSMKATNNPFENVFNVVLLDTQTHSTNEHEINPLSRTRLLKGNGSQHIIIEWTPEGLKSSKDSETTRVTCNQHMPKPTVEDCLQQFLSEEFLGQKDLWFCPKCKLDKAASKKLDIWRLPKVLVLHLKRFKATSYFGDKINSEVLFPIRDLNLVDYVPSTKNGAEDNIYDLVAVSNHVGCLAGGHYFAYAKNCIDNCWYKFDDSSTSVVEETDIVTKSAYVLVYVARSCTNNNNLEGIKNGSCDMEVDIDERE